ncbi:Hypothetical protein RM25_1559 [Propionibacterium freudenreichii subsp. freudenreichii]|nr:Hypothetical protein RM25_1559 [Propionibacterium freudenreichii subsp. freudenreichii]
MWRSISATVAWTEPCGRQQPDRVRRGGAARTGGPHGPVAASRDHNAAVMMAAICLIFSVLVVGPQSMLTTSVGQPWVSGM